MKDANISGVSPAQSGDYEELAAFLASFPGEVRTKDVWRGRFSAWWDLNPSFTSAPSRGWILRNQGKIVGFLGTIPIKMRLGGKEIICFGGTTWRVLQNFRGSSMLLKRRQMQDQKDHLHITTTPRREVAKMLELLRYQHIDRGVDTGEQSIAILNFEHFLEKKLAGRFGGTTIAKLIAPLLHCFQSIFSLFMSGNSKRGNVREITKADRTFDELWERTRTRYLNTNIRTSEMLNWYCFSLKEPAKILLGYYEGDTLLGYMVLLLSSDRETKMLECVDLWIDPAQNEETTLRGLVAKAIKYGRDRRFDRIVFPHFDARTATLYKKCRLLSRPAWERREYIKAPSDVLEKIIPTNSYFVTAQGDYGL